MARALSFYLRVEYSCDGGTRMLLAMARALMTHVHFLRVAHPLSLSHLELECSRYRYIYTYIISLDIYYGGGARTNMLLAMEMAPMAHVFFLRDAHPLSVVSSLHFIVLYDCTKAKQELIG